MNNNTFLTRKTFAFIGALLISTVTYAQNTMQPGSMTGSAISGSMGGLSMAPASTGLVADASSAFTREWQSVKDAMMLSPAQSEKLLMALKAASVKLSENWGSIENYKKLAANSSGDTLARYKKRIEIAFGERDLIASETETELLSFLADDQTNIVVTAAFHGVSPNHSGSMASMPMGGMGGMAVMGDAEMQIGEFAEKLNADFHSVSIDRIIDDLSSH